MGAALALAPEDTIQPSVCTNEDDNGSVPTLMQRFRQLALTEGVGRKTKRYHELRAEFVDREFTIYFGEETKLANWQTLCVDCHITPPPGSITQCKKVRLNCG